MCVFLFFVKNGGFDWLQYYYVFRKRYLLSVGNSNYYQWNSIFQPHVICTLLRFVSCIHYTHIFICTIHAEKDFSIEFIFDLLSNAVCSSSFYFKHTNPWMPFISLNMYSCSRIDTQICLPIAQQMVIRYNLLHS